MKILLVGGGSGGHVTPLKAIASQILKLDPSIQLRVVTDKIFFDRAKFIFKEQKSISVKKIFAGKLRRYHSKSILWHITHVPTVAKNLRDSIYIVIGFFQSLFIYFSFKPDVVFCKGGFLCVPVGWAASLFGVPIIIHDSDTKPGLTNRILARFADKIATGMPTEFYPYSKKRVVYTGIPVAGEYKPLSKQQQNTYKTELGFNKDQPLLLLTGGGNGSVALNLHLSRVAGELLKQGWGVIHLTGVGKSKDVIKVRESLDKKLQKYWHIEEFADMIPRLLASDVIVSRTSASTLQECANAKKLVIGIASPNLADQNMNSEFFASKKAIITLSESDLDKSGTHLLKTVVDNLQNTLVAQNLFDNFAKPNAAQQLAKMILEFKK